ncbi:MAG: dephospho-CoA kinase [Clostridia bacterium]|nr:dephospho-CoA kinase [Clostridia bacterium]
MKKTIGLTGPTGAGKSLAAAVAEKMGVQVLDCDRLARQAVLPGTPGLAALTAVFGKEILLPDGTLNRKETARRAFCDPAHTALLNRTLLPHIIPLVEAARTTDRVLLDAPTLFESGLDAECDAVVAVLAARELRRTRIMERDGLTADEAELRIHAGKTDTFYTERTSYILHNNGDTETFLTEAASLFKKLYGGN